MTNVKVRTPPISGPQTGNDHWSSSCPHGAENVMKSHFLFSFHKGEMSILSQSLFLLPPSHLSGLILFAGEFFFFNGRHLKTHIGGRGSWNDVIHIVYCI